MENQAQTSQSHYNCEHCGRIYKRKSSLQHHITIKHEAIALIKVKLQNEHLQLKYNLMVYQVRCFKQHFLIQENMLDILLISVTDCSLVLFVLTANVIRLNEWSSYRYGISIWSLFLISKTLLNLDGCFIEFLSFLIYNE